MRPVRKLNLDKGERTTGGTGNTGGIAFKVGPTNLSGVASTIEISLFDFPRGPRAPRGSVPVLVVAAWPRRVIRGFLWI